MLIKYRKFGVLAVSLLILLACTTGGMAAESESSEGAEGLPALPLILQGEMDVNGEPVATGSEILAYYEGKLIAKSTVDEEGEFSLNLNLAPENYGNLEEVEFYINDKKAELDISAADLESIETEGPGSIVEINVQGSVSSSSGSSNSDDDENEATIVNKSEETSEPSADGEDTDYLEEDSEGNTSDVEAKGGAESSGDQPVIWVILAIAAILGAILILRKMLVG
ncbi:hypothetical protein FTO70_01985 [Methanosarcina sp. KYL-1]|uniref:hypothetical protein n=1 Tax=Methanosarcina sp. KYL-1 TaxID=2602068 RepID=UPI002100E9C3|nr:hypothetical protein [Methanosarcina sp. KYL-1]MCQ1534484.1 hypothetical protein [Methanosarcina sp. KYL-1]